MNSEHTPCVRRSLNDDISSYKATIESNSSRIRSRHADTHPHVHPKKKSCPYDVAAFRASDHYESAALSIQRVQKLHCWPRQNSSPKDKHKRNEKIREDLWNALALDERIVETPRAEKWTTMSAVRRGGRKNCGGARRPEEDHRGSA